jgi:hypothetical protein
MLQLRVRVLRHAKREVIFLKNKITRALMGRTEKAIEMDPHMSGLKSGVLVRVRSNDEIEKMLDDHEKYRGCRFINEMYDHCGNTYRVLKIIDNFYDEAKKQMCKCKDTVILEGVVCSGRQRLYSMSCDRQCFFFWHTAWLEWVGE